MSKNQNFELFDDLIEDDRQSIDSAQEIPKTNLDFLDIDTVMEKTRDCSMDSEHEFNISKKQLAHNCTLESIVKMGLNPSEFELDISQKIPKMAKEYPFELDDF